MKEIRTVGTGERENAARKLRDGFDTHTNELTKEKVVELLYQFGFCVAGGEEFISLYVGIPRTPYYDFAIDRLMPLLQSVYELAQQSISQEVKNANND